MSAPVESIAGRRIFAVDVELACSQWIAVCGAAGPLAEEAARLALTRGLERLGLDLRGRIELGVTLADDAAIRRLNRDYRGCDAPTNVLAFPGDDPAAVLPPGAPLLLGDVLLACETVEREAAGQNKPVADHLRHLVIHGVLHLLGFDHEAAAQAMAMEAFETNILTELGVPDPYNATN